MPEYINLRPQHPLSPLVLPYLPMPRPAKPSSGRTSPQTNANPPTPARIQEHRHYATLITWIDKGLVYPNQHLKPAFHQILRDFDAYTESC